MINVMSTDNTSSATRAEAVSGAVKTPRRRVAA